jgi:Tol biopolymer transport system component
MTTTFRLTRFDRAVLIVALVLLALIGATLLLGDRVGVTLIDVSPLGTARSTSVIAIRFSETMDRASVEPRFRLEPPVSGAITWSGPIMRFRPTEAFTPDADYTAVLEAGAQSAAGRAVLSEYRFSFTIAPPRVAYLAPADGVPQNVHLSDPALGGQQQLTYSPSGIYDFAVSPDGTRLAFAELNTDTGTADIKLLELATGALQQLTNCQDASCTNPVWRPDGGAIAYERVEYNTGLDNIGASPRRVWLLDLSTTPASTRPLFTESQILGFDPQWSADGSRIAVIDPGAGAILVYDFEQGSIIGVPSRAGSSGALSPDGTRLVYPEITLIDGGAARQFLRVVDLADGSQIDLGTLDDPYEDARAIWHPDGTRLAVARRYLDERHTRGYQIVLINPDTGEIEQLTDDPRYNNQFFWFDPTGTRLLMQRFPELDANMQPNASGRPEIWTLELASREMIMLATNAYLPRWSP